jgi:hypothetical protein
MSGKGEVNDDLWSRVRSRRGNQLSSLVLSDVLAVAQKCGVAVPPTVAGGGGGGGGSPSKKEVEVRERSNRLGRGGNGWRS